MSPDPTPPPGGGPQHATCPVCRGEFLPQGRQVYCSPRCKSAFHRQPTTEPQPRTCPICRTTFTTEPSIRQVYCSTDCRREAEKQRNDQRNLERALRLGEAPPQPRPAPTLPPASRTGPGRDPMEPTATRACPHCHQPVTIVALLATPEAARPAIPNHPDVLPLRRTP